MAAQSEIQSKLSAHAKAISEELNGAPVVVIAAGSRDANIGATVTEAHIPGDDVRLRDLLGILQTAIQIESMQHFRR